MNLPSIQDAALLILNDSTARELLSRLLGGLGYSIQHARDCYQGIDLSEKYPGQISLIVTAFHDSELTAASAFGLLDRHFHGAKVVHWAPHPVEQVPLFVERLIVGYELTTDELADTIAASQGPRAELKERIHLALLVEEVTAILNSGDELRPVLGRCAEAVARHLDAASCQIWTLDAKAGMLESQANAGPSTQLDATNDRAGHIATLGEPLLSNAVQEDDQFQGEDWARREGLVAYAGHPLMIEGRVMGVMSVFCRHRLSEITIEALGGVSGHIALGIERKRIQAALEETEARFREIMGSISQVVWVRDLPSGKLLYVNPAFEQTFGEGPERMFASPEDVLDYVHGEDRELVSEMKQRSVQGPQEGTFRIVRPDGEQRTLRVKTFRVSNEAGEAYRVVGIADDITEHRKVEERLRHAERMQIVGQLAGGVAHDFNNLLTVILGYCELMRSQLYKDDPVYPYFESIQRSAERGASLTKQLLAFGKRQFLQPKTVDLTGMVLEMERIVQRVIGDHIEMSVAAPESLWSVHVDPDQIQQVILNLVINARDAMHAGGKLTIQLANTTREEGNSAPEVPAGDYVTLTVTDTGVGMDATTRERIFEPFFTTKGSGGSGLGLAMVHGTIQQSGGYIQVYSEPGIGTTFRIYLPAVGGTPEAIPAKPVLGGLHGTETILLVEDEGALLHLESKILRDYGYQVLQASNGEEGMRICEDYPGPIHLIITDVVMPNMSGREMAAFAGRHRPKAKLIFVSGYAEDFAFRTEVMPPGSTFLQKPFQFDVLAARIREALDAPRVGKPRILIVEDEEAVRGIIVKMVGGETWEIIEAANGQRALELFREQPADLVITDLVMPETDGLELIRTLRKENPEVKILAISGASEGFFLDIAKRLGADEIVEKPFTQGVLQGAVGRLLGKG